jgi:energy-converting hydrogenase Eha subunit C
MAHIYGFCAIDGVDTIMLLLGLLSWLRWSTAWRSLSLHIPASLVKAISTVILTVSVLVRSAKLP